MRASGSAYLQNRKHLPLTDFSADCRRKSASGADRKLQCTLDAFLVRSIVTALQLLPALVADTVCLSVSIIMNALKHYNSGSISNYVRVVFL